jgi:hypothetical protein
MPGFKITLSKAKSSGFSKGPEREIISIEWSEISKPKGFEARSLKVEF